MTPSGRTSHRLLALSGTLISALNMKRLVLNRIALKSSGTAGFPCISPKIREFHGGDSFAAASQRKRRVSKKLGSQLNGDGWKARLSEVVGPRNQSTCSI